MSVPAVALEPGEAALAFVKLLQADEKPNAELLEESALSPHCGEIRRAEISQRLVRLGRHLRLNQFDFGVVGEKRDGEFASVLLSASSEHDPMGVEVLALGLRLKDGGNWGVAPVPGSFDNVDLGFDEALEERVDQLERWMATERLRKLRILHAEAHRDFRERMAMAVPGDLLQRANPAQLVETFVQACLDRNLPAAMVLLGRFENSATEEDRQIQRILSRGLRGLDQHQRWRLLTSPDVVRVVVQEDPGDDLDAEVEVLLFDPSDSKPIHLLRFVLLRSGKRWNIELPASLLLADAEGRRFQQALWDERDSDNERLKDHFESFFEEKHKPRRVQDLQEAGKRIEKTLREGSLEEFFGYVHRSEDLTESERRMAYRYLGGFWTNMHKDNKAATDGELIAVIEHGDAAILAFHFISTQMDQIALVPLILLKEEAGWAIAPGVTRAANYAALDEKRRQNLTASADKFDEQREELTKKAAQGFLRHFAVAKPAPGAVVLEEEAAALVRNYRTHLREGRLLEVFACCALLDQDTGIWKALESLSHEYRGVRTAREPDRQLLVSAGTPWAAVSLRVENPPSSDPDYSMYLVVATEAGPRIVVDGALRLAKNKGREVINKRVWDHIAEKLEEKETALVRTLFQRHIERSKTDLAEWEKSNKSSR